MQNGGPSNNGGYNSNRARYPRTAAEPQFNNGMGVYPVPGQQRSYETVTTASGGSGEAAGYATDPSSENSSIDRFAAAQPKEPVDNYGFGGFGANPQFQPLGNSINEHPDQNGYYGQNGQNPPIQRRQVNGYQNNRLPPVPPSKDNSRGPVRLTASASSNNLQNSRPPPTGRPSPPEKRKSWLSRRFSRS